MPRELDWWVLIDKKAALKERFPPLSKVRNERPGCAADVERKRRFREATELAKARNAQARWDAAVAENARRLERAENRRRAINYKAQRAARNQMREAS